MLQLKAEFQDFSLKQAVYTQLTSGPDMKLAEQYGLDAESEYLECMMAAQEWLYNADKLGHVPEPAGTDTSSGNTQAAALHKLDRQITFMCSAQDHRLDITQTQVSRLESIVQTAVEARAAKANDTQKHSTPIIPNTKCVSFVGDIFEVLGNNMSQESQNVTSALMAMTNSLDSLKTVLKDSKIITSVQRKPKL